MYCIQYVRGKLCAQRRAASNSLLAILVHTSSTYLLWHRAPVGLIPQPPGQAAPWGFLDRHARDSSKTWEQSPRALPIALSFAPGLLVVPPPSVVGPAPGS